VVALSGTSVLGLRTNRDYLLACLRAQPFIDARLATRWLGEASASWSAPVADARWLAVAAAIHLHRRDQVHGSFARWSNVGRREVPIRLQVEGQTHRLRLGL
jgi:acetyl/propionyl-CoA carboxylase alpha subunit